MSVFQGDFLGFTLGDIHSSLLNITRVSSSDRYENNLLPTFKDSTVEIPGGDGTYYFDTNYSSRTFNIDFAYDNLHDEDMRALSQTLGFKGIQPLIFDETPYKKYMVKCAAQPSLKYICFDQYGTRIYKGEGTVSLIAYYPYAISTVPTIANNTSSNFLSNEGDIETNLQVTYNINQVTPLNNLVLKLQDITQLDLYTLTLNKISKQSTNDGYILVDFDTHLIEGLDSNFKKTGNLYNKFIKSGDFFKLPVGQFYFQSNAIATEIKYNMLYY